MNPLTTFTSTGWKILRQPDLIKSFQEGRPAPQSLQVALTEKCNLKCSFCSVKNREGGFEFDLNHLMSATAKFIELGTRTVEITGGGEPLCYPHLNRYLSYLLGTGVKVGLITNGININTKISRFLIENISWIRISANAYDYTGSLEMPEFPGTLGFSYVWDDKFSSVRTLAHLKELSPKYIRLVPDCIGTEEEQREKNQYLSRLAKWLGPPVFFQWKEFKAPAHCYWGYLKPFLYPDGYVYPCSSIVLNPDAGRKFHEAYRLSHWSAIESIWRSPVRSLTDTTKCTHCVFTSQNEMLEYCLSPQGHEDFI